MLSFSSFYQVNEIFMEIIFPMWHLRNEDDLKLLTRGLRDQTGGSTQHPRRAPAPVTLLLHFVSNRCQDCRKGKHGNFQFNVCFIIMILCTMPANLGGYPKNNVG